MKKRTKKIMETSLRESTKYISAGLFAGLIVAIWTGQPLLDMSKLESYIFVPVLYIIGTLGLFILIFCLNIIAED